MTRVVHGQDIIINGGKCYAGSVAGYAREYGEDEQAAVARATQRGHELYWIGLHASTLCADPGFYASERAKWANVPVLHTGDTIQIEDSPVFVIGTAPNHNFSLRVAA